MNEIVYGITREYLENQSIVLFRVRTLNISILEAWNNVIIATIEDWPVESKSILALYDLSGGGVSMPFLVLNGFKIFNVGVSPLGRRLVEKVLEKRLDTTVKLAFLFADSVSGQITFKRGLEGPGRDGQFEYRVFFDQPSALEWLRSFVPRTTTPK